MPLLWDHLKLQVTPQSLSVLASAKSSTGRGEDSHDVRHARFECQRKRGNFRIPRTTLVGPRICCHDRFQDRLGILVTLEVLNYQFTGRQLDLEILENQSLACSCADACYLGQPSISSPICSTVLEAASSLDRGGYVPTPFLGVSHRPSCPHFLHITFCGAAELRPRCHSGLHIRMVWFSRWTQGNHTGRPGALKRMSTPSPPHPQNPGKNKRTHLYLSCNTHELGIDNSVYWFQICESVYAGEQFEKPDITKEGKEIRKIDILMIDIEGEETRVDEREF